METNNKEKVLDIGDTEKKKEPVKKETKSLKDLKKPISKDNNLKEKLAKASGKTAESTKPKSKKEDPNVASDYEKVMARNKALREVHEKMDSDSNPDFSQTDIELDRVVDENAKSFIGIIEEQERIEDFELKRKKLKVSNLELQEELEEINKDKKDLDFTLKEIQIKIDEESNKIKQLESLKIDIEKNLKDFSLESKNYRNISEKNEKLIKKMQDELVLEQNNVKKLEAEIKKAKGEIAKLKKSLKEQESKKKETVSKEDELEFKALIKEKDKEIRAKQRLIDNRDKKIIKISDDLKEAKKELRAAVASNKRELKKFEKLNESFNETKKELAVANKEVVNLSKALEKQEEEFKAAEDKIGKEYLRLKNSFDKEIENLNNQISKMETKEEKDDSDEIIAKYEEQEQIYQTTLKTVKDDYDNELLKKEIEYSEKLHEHLNSHQEDILELQNLIAQYKEDISTLQLLASKRGQTEAVATMQRIKEEVVKNREIMKNIAGDIEDLNVEDDIGSINYQQLIDSKEKELEELEVLNKQHLDQIDKLLVELSIVNNKLQDLNDKINSISEKDIHDPDFKRNISEIRERKSELISRANEEAQMNEKALSNLHKNIDLKKADIKRVEQEILQTEEFYQSKRNKTYSDKLEHEKQMRKLNYGLDLHQIKLHELSVDEKERLKNKYQVFVDDYNKRMKEYNLSEQELIEYYLGKTRAEVISKEDEKLYAEQEQEKEELSQKLFSIKQSQKLVAKRIRDLKKEIYGLKRLLEEFNNPSLDDYERSKDYILKDVESKLLQLQKEYAVYHEKLQILNERREKRFIVRNKLLVNEHIIFDYAKLFNHLKKIDYSYRQNQTKQKNLNEDLSFGEVKNSNKETIKNEISLLDKEQERLYKEMEETRKKLRSIKTHEKVSYFVELENSIARLKIIENNLDILIKESKNNIDIKTQELNILKTGTY